MDALADLPDLPRWALVRGPLRDGAAEVRAGAHGAVVLHQAAEYAFVLGSPDDDALAAALDCCEEIVAVPEDAEVLVGGEVASSCTALAITETLWDLAVETDAAHRRRGYGTAAFVHLARRLAARGLRPLWGAADANAASLAMARALGFRPVDRLAVWERPAAG